MLFNLHTHTKFSDGAGEPELYLEEAIHQGFSAIGFSDHSPVPFTNSFAIREEELMNYAETIKKLKIQYASGNPGKPTTDHRINVFLGLEIDFIPGITRPIAEFREQLSLDFTIGSVHLVCNSDPENLWFIDGPEVATYDQGLNDVFGGDIRKGVTAYYRQIQEMVTLHKPAIIGHLDKIKMHNRDRFFSEEEPWYTTLVDETLDLVKQSGCIVEVNTRGLYKKRSETLFPGPAILKKLLAMNIPVTVASDAHKPHELSLLFAETKAFLTYLGFRDIMNLTPAGWETVSLNSFLCSK